MTGSAQRIETAADVDRDWSRRRSRLAERVKSSSGLHVNATGDDEMRKVDE